MHAVSRKLSWKKDFKEELLTFPRYSTEAEQNDTIGRVGLYYKSSVGHRRREDL
jgi:hypothetical protein